MNALMGEQHPEKEKGRENRRGENGSGRGAKVKAGSRKQVERRKGKKGLKR